MMRRKMAKGKSKKLFQRTARKVHKKNHRPYVSRGGIRL